MFNSFLKIIKWRNLLHIVVVQFLIKYCFLYGYSFNTKLSFIDLTLLSLTTISILSSGYLYSYCLLPKRFEEKFSKKHAYVLSIFFGLIGIVLGIYISFFIDKPFYSLIIFTLLVTTIFYFKFIRTKNFFTNIATSYTRVFSVLLVWWFDYPISLNYAQNELFFKLQIVTISLVIYSFFANTIRGVLFDVKNINKDYKNNHKTIPVVLGRKTTSELIKNILIFLTIITIAIMITFIKDQFILVTMFFTINIPQLWFIYQLSIANSEKAFDKLLEKGNIAYYATFMCVPFFTYYFKYVI